MIEELPSAGENAYLTLKADNELTNSNHSMTVQLFFEHVETTFNVAIIGLKDRIGEVSWA